jgi:transcriptional regulator with XRE-family HTH domain
MENSIKEIRKRKGVTQVQLAKMIGVSQGAIHKLETGQRGFDLNWMQKIAKALDIEAWELLPKDMQPNISPEEQEILRTIRKIKSSNEVTSTTKTI